MVALRVSVASRIAWRSGSRTACRLRVGFRSIGLPSGVPAVVWLERGAQDHPESGVPAAVLHSLEGRTVMTVLIGIDPHKLSHAACAIDDQEHDLAQLSVRSGPHQLEQLLGWAQPFAR